MYSKLRSRVTSSTSPVILPSAARQVARSTYATGASRRVVYRAPVDGCAHACCRINSGTARRCEINSDARLATNFTIRITIRAEGLRKPGGMARNAPRSSMDLPMYIASRRMHYFPPDAGNCGFLGRQIGVVLATDLARASPGASPVASQFAERTYNRYLFSVK